MQYPSVHDNFVYAYSVFADLRRIVLHTEYSDAAPKMPIEYTDVVFSGVLAHHFQCCLHQNILFDVREEGLGAVLRDNASLFNSLKNYGWPPEPAQYRDLPELQQLFAEKNVRAYRVDSSYGLEGFVLCDSVQYVKRESRAYPAVSE